MQKTSTIAKGFPEFSTSEAQAPLGDWRSYQSQGLGSWIVCSETHADTTGFSTDILQTVPRLVDDRPFNILDAFQTPAPRNTDPENASANINKPKTNPETNPDINTHHSNTHNSHIQNLPQARNPSSPILSARLNNQDHCTNPLHAPSSLPPPSSISCYMQPKCTSLPTYTDMLQV
mmetsp:Transcript_27392/g.43487  ORF Transcript_27392/g.43487 Transcript_27392/m.43487 type:complete len:176 (-) Transcript_27392:211-738(-)